MHDFVRTWIRIFRQVHGVFHAYSNMLWYGCLLYSSYLEEIKISINQCTVFKGAFSFYVLDTFKGKRLAYLLLLIAYVIENLANASRAVLELLFQLGRPLCWSPDKIGVFSALRHVPQGLAGIFLIKPLQSCLSDINIAILSLIFDTGSYVLEGLARTDAMMYSGEHVFSINSFTFLCVKSSAKLCLFEEQSSHPRSKTRLVCFMNKYSSEN